MFKQIPRYLVVVALAAAVAIASAALPAFAGGWAVVTLDRLPDNVVAGEPVTVGFVVRQHGHQPLSGLNPAIAIQKEGGDAPVRVDASADGAPGHYAATLTFPSAGVWNWSINSGFWPETQPMPALSVFDRSGSMPASKAAVPSSWPFAVGIAGLAGMAGGLLALVRTRAPWAAAITLVAALIGGVGFASASMRATASPSTASAQSQAELGERLFIAKGCVVCHTHDAMSDARRVIGFNYEEAPNLTEYSAAPDYLAKWLDDPASVRPYTAMPRLDLSAGEIDALVAFINAP